MKKLFILVSFVQLFAAQQGTLVTQLRSQFSGDSTNITDDIVSAIQSNVPGQLDSYLAFMRKPDNLGTLQGIKYNKDSQSYDSGILIQSRLRSDFTKNNKWGTNLLHMCWGIKSRNQAVPIQLGILFSGHCGYTSYPGLSDNGKFAEQVMKPWYQSAVLTTIHDHLKQKGYTLDKNTVASDSSDTLVQPHKTVYCTFNGTTDIQESFLGRRLVTSSVALGSITATWWLLRNRS